MDASPPTLRPLSLGELLDRSVRLWRGHLGPLFRQMLPFVIAAQIVLVLADVLVLHDLQRLLEDTRELAPILEAVGLLYVMLGLNAVIVWVAQVRVAQTLLPRLLGIEAHALRPDPSPLKVVLHLCLYVGYLVLISAAILGPAIAGVVALALGRGRLGDGTSMVLALILIGMSLLVWFGALLWWMLRANLAMPLIAAEQGGPWALFRRGGLLLEGRIGPGFLGLSKVRAGIIATVVTVLSSVAQLVATLPRLILDAIFKDPKDPSAIIPWLWRVPAEALVAAGQATFAPLVVAGCVLLYVDLRVRREGLDLELALERSP